MPYIKPENRIIYDTAIKQIAELVRVVGRDKCAGELNYIITTILKAVYGDRECYATHNEIIGMLECCKAEWYRRQVSEYENLKIKENGDV